MSIVSLLKQEDDTDALMENARRAAAFLKAIGHESRLVILCTLAEGEKSVGELEKLLKQRQAGVSQQLARLRSEGLVKARRDGKMVYYSLSSDEARAVVGIVYQMFCAR
ncbi:MULTISPECIES: metalloregulator ArsR/SmtB family transcription factor [unclassified Minwuia]|jgi:ArsR family transcriptional regulator, virulence genes transcriptional regulator|uniref:ArsR/SmtB family transcription factor n=1 Tax=unclassified Minwuia TaxID=2618799 RepID=UPI002478FC75|nr:MULTISPECIES: metalloregulator ArsR/SmtB family transcription factor [unclassified Minwuia]